MIKRITCAHDKKKAMFVAASVLIILSIVSSCKKNSKSPTVTESQEMKFALNGTVISYNTCQARVDTINGVVQMQIIGQNSVSDGSGKFAVVIYSDILFSGEVIPVAVVPNEPKTMYLGYFPDPNDDYFTIEQNPVGVVNITNIGSGFIQGTFSGNLYSSTDPADLKYTLTGGSFTAKMQ